MDATKSEKGHTKADVDHELLSGINSLHLESTNKERNLPRSKELETVLLKH